MPFVDSKDCKVYCMSDRAAVAAAAAQRIVEEVSFMRLYPKRSRWAVQYYLRGGSYRCSRCSMAPKGLRQLPNLISDKVHQIRHPFDSTTDFRASLTRQQTQGSPRFPSLFVEIASPHVRWRPRAPVHSQGQVTRAARRSAEVPVGASLGPSFVI